MKSVGDLKVRQLEGFQVSDGTDCAEKMVYAGGCFATAGLLAGTLQGAYPETWPKVTIRGPKLMMTLYLMSRHTITGGLVGAAFAVGACLSAKYWNREGVRNCVAGGALSGAVFGLRYRRTHALGWSSVGMGVMIAIVTSVYKLFHGTYLPALPPDYPREYMERRKSEARSGELRLITEQRITEYNEWRSRQ